MPSEGVSKTLTFMDLMTQRRYGNNIEQCPCIILPGSNKCMVYDSRYQAALIEEAMLTFVDSSMDPRIFEDEMSGQQISYHTLECLTEECRQCVGMLQYSPPATKMAPIEQLISAGAPMRLAMQREQFYSEFAHKVNQALNMNHAAGAHPISSLFTNKEIAQKRSSTSSSSTTTTIPLRDGNVPYNNYPSSPPSQIPYRIALKPSQQYQNKWKTNTNYQQNRRNYMRIVDRDILKEGNRRHVRQTKKHERPVIGSRFVINCVERGEPESDQTDQLNLCTACWTWRQLSEEYFPRLINELVCQSSDYCLSGWGTCNQRYRNFDVLQKVTVNGQDEWRPTTISAASCCDCKVKAGSQAHHLVFLFFYFLVKN
ncbi:hypothetical protein Mgra_00006788 [Meloidogyne graminicola]|uniref:Uncharacterized protein n=1 Tax=Meloidogyne graminicola TaxID=189291 RepID=A0A8S9ZKE0_9BILA|nr:hypothetical protein Mgra_00006788 [Meloidogyne graminicola]